MIEAKQTQLIPEIGKIEAKKNKLDRSKTNRGSIFKTFMEPRNQFQGIDSVSLCPGGPEPIFVPFNTFISISQFYNSSVTKSPPPDMKIQLD